MNLASAWVLRARGTRNDDGLFEQRIALPNPAEGEALVEPLYGSWEANMSHAIQRMPIDICAARGEDFVVLGNAGVVRVLDVGAGTGAVRPGQICLFLSSGTQDQHGYMTLAHAYDRPGSIGLLAKQTVVPARNLIEVPRGSRFSLPQWAVFSGKYLTAWSNWRVALGALRLQLSELDLPSPIAWGWGGGTTLAELDLARRQGCRVTMMCASASRTREIESLGITVVDRGQYSDLSYDHERSLVDREFRAAYRRAEDRFASEVTRRTEGAGVSIFIDYIGSPVFRASLRVLARQGVLTTAGWKAGMNTQTLRARECIQRHIHVHTHYARLAEGLPAVLYAEDTGWMPPEPPVYEWNDIPLLAKEHLAGAIPSHFAAFAVNPV